MSGDTILPEQTKKVSAFLRKEEKKIRKETRKVWRITWSIEAYLDAVNKDLREEAAVARRKAFKVVK